MKPHELILLSSYRFPAGHAMALADDDMAAWMNAYTALWHPAALWGAAGPPRVDSPYDHENPEPHQIFGVPESPPLMLSEDWPERVRAAGAVILPGTRDRPVMLAKAAEALSQSAACGLAQTSSEGDAETRAKLLALEPCQVQPFFALGLGYLLQAALSEAMEHENLLQRDEFWLDIQRALAELAGVPYSKGSEAETPADEPTLFPDDPGEPGLTTGTDSPAAAATDGATGGNGDTVPTFSESEQFPEVAEMRRTEGVNGHGPGGRAAVEEMAIRESWYVHLHSAAQRLRTAREVLYPVTIYLLDVFLPDAADPGQHWPAAFDRGVPLNVVASGSLLEQLAKTCPDRLAELRQKVHGNTAEVCGGCYLEREDNLLPIESQFWNLLKGQHVSNNLLGKRIEVFARQHYYGHPQLPLFLSTCGLNRALIVPFDDAAGPTFRTTLVNWPSPDGKQLDAFCRTPFAADSNETFFNLAHHLHRTIREDHAATIAFVHRQKSAVPWYEDFLELCRFGPIFGEFMTFSQYFSQASAGEYSGSHGADEFHFDELGARCGYGTPEGKSPTPFPVSGLAVHTRLRRRLEVCRTLAAMQRGLAGRGDALRLEATLCELEQEIESSARFFPSPPQGEGSVLVPLPPTGGEGLGVWGVPQALAPLTPNPSPPVGERGAERPLAANHSPPEGRGEQNTGDHQPEAIASRLTQAEHDALQALAGRLLTRATADTPGYLIVNPCSFRRRVALELDRAAAPLVVADPVKACQLDDSRMLVVAEVPALGFAWIPQSGPPGSPAPTARMRLADETHVRNEFLEAEIDPQTGGLRSVADRRSMINRLSQKLVFNPGSTMQATSVRVVSTGPALGEIVTEGVLVGLQQQRLAQFRQRLRVWLGRPVLEVRIEIIPEQPAAGYPWHAYYGCRFAWGDERATLLRGVNGASHVTTHLRPQTPDFLEVRGHRHNTVIFPGGLPFLRRHENRMVDVILMPQGETSQTFDLAVALDREYPMQSALEIITPVPYIATAKGPPHVGASGWLYHLDTLNLLLTSMRPGGRNLSAGYAAPDAAITQTRFDAVTVRLLECSGQSGQAEFHCARNPTRAGVLNARGDLLLEAGINGDAALLEVTPNDFNELQMEFSSDEPQS